MTKSMDPQELLQIICKEIDDTKGIDICVLDLRGRVSFADYFVVVSGGSDRHVQALADRVEMKLKKDFKRYAKSIEGYNAAHWILMDYGDVVVHVFDQESREFYDLESIWQDAPRIVLESLLH